MEEVWKCSDVGRATIWYCSSYQGEDATPKCLFLTTSLTVLFARMSFPPLTALRLLQAIPGAGSSVLSHSRRGLLG